jgi:prepilin-type processing-associated H-X9-DG protein
MDLESARRRVLERADLNAFISVSSEDGTGTVVAVKDLVDVAGMVTTAGGVILPREPATEDAPVIRRLRQEGCVVVGKANLHEFAYGITSVNPHYGAVRNPHDVERVAGGSSGGSAVAVAAGMCDWAVGTDTGGSIRIPASFCGVVGFKPQPGSIDMTPRPSNNVALTNRDDPGNTQTIRFRHMRDTVANALMVDGHVESFRYEPKKAPNDPTVTTLLRKNIYVNN